MSAHNMTPDEYRARWGLPAAYSMVAPSCAEKRSSLARERVVWVGKFQHIMKSRTV